MDICQTRQTLKKWAKIEPEKILRKLSTSVNSKILIPKPRAGLLKNVKKLEEYNIRQLFGIITGHNLLNIIYTQNENQKGSLSKSTKLNIQ